MKITKDSFKELTRSIEEKFNEAYKKEYDTPPNITQTYGLPGHDKSKNTLVREIIESEKVKIELAKFNKGISDAKKFTPSTRYLYNKKKLIEKDTKPKGEVIEKGFSYRFRKL